VDLKKPTEFFGKNNNQKEEVVTDLPENLSEYKSNLKNIEVLNEFTENFGSFTDNITKINTLEEGIQELKEELKNTLKQEDLDNAVMSNLLILEKNIDKIQKSLKGINRENLQSIYEEVENISNQVLLVTEELPRYKNLIKSNEVSLDKKLIQYQESVNEHLTDFNTFIGNKFDIIEQSIENSIEGINLKIQEIQQSFETLFENEVPKYQNLLANAKIENDKKVESIVNKLTHKINALAENTLKLNEELEDKSNVLDQAFETKISALESYILNAKKEAEETTQTYRKLYQVIEAKGLSDRSQFDTYEKAISHISSQFSSVYEKIEETKKEIEKKELYQEELNNIQESFNQKFIQVETLIENKNQKLKEANKVLVDNIVSLKEEVSKISVSELHQNYHQILRKVNHIEEVFNKFNEKTILNEGLLNEPPTVKTSDPLTPLNQNFVTLDQLQSHYRLFINRIQQQLATIGGGGETQLKYLDDIVGIATNPSAYNNKYLKYNHSAGTFEFVSVFGGEGAGYLIDLDDIDVTNLGNGSYLRYDATTSKFVFSTVAAEGLELIAGNIESGIVTTNSTSPTTIISFSASTYRSANFQIQATNGSNYNVTTINAVHDGSTSYMVEYGTINQPVGIATFSTEIIGGSLVLLGHPSLSSTTTFKVLVNVINT
jgi:chromosome segregation ATPase